MTTTTDTGSASRSTGLRVLGTTVFTEIGSVNSREKSRQGRLLVISVLLAITAPALVALGAASWS